MAGLYATDGSLNITVVDGSTNTGLYATDGSYNVVVSTGTSAAGKVQHPCGALFVFPVTASTQNYYNNDGSINITTTPYPYTAQRVTVVSGSLGGGNVGQSVGLLLALTYAS